MPNKRTSIILNYLKEKKYMRLKDICALFPEYNEMTIRRDLIFLENNGYIVRTHGGAEIREENIVESFSYNNRSLSMIQEKRQIGVKASLLLKEKILIFLDAGTTNLEFAKIMPDMPLFVVTNCPIICVELAKKEKVDVIMVGGMLSKSAISISGTEFMKSLNAIVNIAFLGSAGFSLENGFSDSHMSETEFKKYIVSSSEKTIILMDHSKIGKDRRFAFAKLEDVDGIICDKPFDEKVTEKLIENNVTMF